MCVRSAVAEREKQRRVAEHDLQVVEKVSDRLVELARCVRVKRRVAEHDLRVVEKMSVSEKFVHKIKNFC